MSSTSSTSGSRRSSWAAAFVQVGASSFHLRSGEVKALPMNLVLLLLAVAAVVPGLLVWV